MTDAPVAPVPSAAAEYAEQTLRFRSTVEEIRKRSDLSAKALAALGTTTLTAVGIAKFADVFPLPAGWTSDWELGLAVVATPGGFALLGVALAAFTARFWQVSSPVFVSSDLTEMEVELDAEGLADAERRFQATAARHSAPSLRACEARAERFDRMADRAVEPRRGALREEAAVIRAEVRATLAHVGADAVRSRATRAVRGRWAIAFGALFLFALMLFALGADYLDGERSGRTSIADECAASVKALREQGLKATELPKICGSPQTGEPTPEAGVALAQGCAAAAKALDERRLNADRLAEQCTGTVRKPLDQPPPPTSAGVERGTVAELGKRVGECFSAASTRPDRERCRRLNRALLAAAGP